ncbi:hypothetical protein TWF173_005484 [Orbilia oligospora]|nr:hypothetical protein TWF173_005484 [Orbilia oligospora]
MTLLRFSSSELLENMFKSGQSSGRSSRSKRERPKLPIKPVDLSMRERPDLLVTYNIRIRGSNLEVAPLARYCQIDFFNFWLMFFIDIKENDTNPPRGPWRCLPEHEWMYHAPYIPAPETVNMYTMLRYPLMEYYALHVVHFMKYISTRHDSEIIIRRDRLELVKERIHHLDRVFRSVVNFIPADLMEAKMSKPWYKFGKSDYFKSQKVWVGKELMAYRRSLQVTRECIESMLDTMFPYGPDKNEDEAPLSSWKFASNFEGQIIGVPDWTFGDAFIESLGRFAVKEYPRRDEALIKIYKQLAPPRRGEEALKRFISGDAAGHHTKPINLGDHNRRRDARDNCDAWVMDWSEHGIWAARKRFSDLAYINTFGQRAEFFTKVTPAKNYPHGIS